MMFKQRTNPDFIRAAIPRMVQMYQEEGLSVRAISEALGIDKESVRRRLKEAGVDMLPKGGTATKIRRQRRPQFSEQEGPLSQSEVERLRRMVGFDPERDADRNPKWTRTTTTSSVSTEPNQSSESS